VEVAVEVGKLGKKSAIYRVILPLRTLEAMLSGKRVPGAAMRLPADFKIFGTMSRREYFLRCGKRYPAKSAALLCTSRCLPRRIRFGKAAYLPYLQLPVVNR